MKLILYVITLLTVPLATMAQAQFFYSPPPPLMGQPSYHLYSVSGVTTSGGVGTFFSCTNTTSANIRVGIEIFGAPGGGSTNDPSAISLDINSGGTALFGTSGSTWIGIDSSLGAGFISKGSARILATEKKGIICTAFLSDVGNAPPISMVDLKVVAKTKQRGE